MTAHQIMPGDIAISAADDRVVIVLKAPRAILLGPLAVEEVDALIAFLKTARDMAALNRARKRA